MTRNWLPGLLGCGVLLLASANALSQQEEEPASEAPPAAQQEPPEPARTTERSDDSPYDYRASEEISEDLSVSFPVDI